MTSTTSDKVISPSDGKGWVRPLAEMVRLSFQADPRGALVMLVLRIVGAVANGAFAVLTKQLVDGAIARDETRMVHAAVGFGIVTALSWTSGWIGFRMRLALEERVSLLVDRRLLLLSAGLPGIEHHERPDYMKELELLRSSRLTLAQTPGALFETISSILRLFVAAAILGRLHPALILLPLFAVPSALASGKAIRMQQKVYEDMVEDQRLATALFALTTTAEPAKEVRLFGIGDEIVRRYEVAAMGIERAVHRMRVRGAYLQIAGWVVFSLGYAGAIVFVVVRAVEGRSTPGDVILALNLAAQVNGQVSGLVGVVSWLQATLKATRRYVWLDDYGAEITTAMAARPQVPVPDRLTTGIDFAGVSFRYPGTDRDILTGVDLHLPAGATVAVVGENGAGKTTLVKLLCRFYEPTTGRILVDGADLAGMDVGGWRDRMSAGFQDFAKLELVARQTVGVGRLSRLDDEPAVTAALGRASALDVVVTLDDGLETQLGRQFDDGTELSMGQWQKLALGRAMMREDPLLLVLDEPTASLDAQTEHSLFERYAGAAARVASTTGAITVLVSHRFSTVRMADLIVVVEGGTVSEVGSHRELLARGGTYAELYELQARGYR
ncbi:MAG TPA: ABC transporter ATP-binding protein [Acidimicrobiales bacterium]|nr:ABC transporter ATP-binding protein [Acidimicrobiales bacterium]